MSRNNYMGKIDEDWSGTTIPNYDTIRTPEQVLDEARDEFEERFKMVSVCFDLQWHEESQLGADWKDLEKTQLELKAFIINTIKAFIEAEIEIPERMKIKIPTHNIWDNSHSKEYGYNRALSDQITHLKEVTKKWQEEI